MIPGRGKLINRPPRKSEPISKASKGIRKNKQQKALKYQKKAIRLMHKATELLQTEFSDEENFSATSDDDKAEICDDVTQRNDVDELQENQFINEQHDEDNDQVFELQRKSLLVVALIKHQCALLCSKYKDMVQGEKEVCQTQNEKILKLQQNIQKQQDKLRQEKIYKRQLEQQLREAYGHAGPRAESGSDAPSL